MFQPILRKLYYIDHDVYASEYKRRFNEENTIHMDINIGESPAFIYPDFHMYEKIISIYKIDSKIRLICKDLPGIAIHQFQERCLIGEIYQSNNIEGVVSTRKEISEVLQEVKEKKKPRNLMGIVSQYVALIQNDNIPITTCQDVRDLYDRLFSFDIGKADKGDLPDGEIFRNGAVSVISETQKEIHKGLYPEAAIISAMERALAFLLDNTAEPLIKIAAFHYLFGFIHPFYDGNGRTSRFISSALLMDELNSLIGFRISYTIKENLSKYYKAFKICNDPKNKGDISPFVHYFLNMVLVAEHNLLDSLLDRFGKLEHYSKFINDLPNASTPQMHELYNLLIQATLFSNQGISMMELQKNIGLTYNTVKKKLAQIPDSLLVQRKIERKMYFELNLDEVDNDEIT